MTTIKNLPDPLEFKSLTTFKVQEILEGDIGVSSEEATLTALLGVSLRLYEALYVIAQNTAPKTDA